MKGFGMLLLYFFTWRSVILGSAVVGLALVGLAASVVTLSSQGATAILMLAFVLLLAVPYLSAPKALRTIISNRRLAIVPGLPLRAGLAILLLTFVTAGFLPFIGWVLGAPEVIFWLGPQIFIITSLYTLVTQWLVTSRNVWIHVQWLPIALIVFLNLFGKQLLQLANNHTATTLIAALACAGWLAMLVTLARRPNFKPAYATDVNSADRETSTFFSSLFSGKGAQNLSPTTSLLLGYPANFQSRALNMIFVLVLNPVLAVLLMKFMSRNDPNAMTASTAELFLFMSVFTSFVTGTIAWAETGARARLLWLRVPGNRAEVWKTLESMLWAYFAMLLAVTAAIAAVIAVVGQASILLVHYALMLFTLTFYQRYLPLAARLNGWSSLTQSLVLLGSLAAIAFTVVYSLRVANFNLAFLLELCLLLLGVLFRALAKFGFNRADWQVLRPTASKKLEAASA